MASASTISQNATQSPDSSGLLVSLRPMPVEELEAILANLAQAFPGEGALVATQDPAPSSVPPNLRVTNYIPQAPESSVWILTAADYLNAYKLMQEHKATACLVLGPEAQSLAPEALRGLAEAVVDNQADLATPRYTLGPRDGLVNSSILYPVTRALYATRPRYPLAIDLAFSSRMAERLAACAQKFTAVNQNAALIWPVADAAAAGFTIAEVPAGPRALPPPDAANLNSLLAQVAGSFFADIDDKASFWQRARLAYVSKSPTGPSLSSRSAAEGSATSTETNTEHSAPDIQPMLDSFLLAYTNLQEIWSLVLPPNSLLGLKKLSLMPAAAFRMPDALWARIVYDFVLAYRLRTLNRSHLLGALTPLYLAWVASHLLLTSHDSPEHQAVSPEVRIEDLATAFETDKAYLVSRWRWPDRFNP